MRDETKDAARRARPIAVTREVFDGLEEVRQSGETNMLDRVSVAEVADWLELPVTARWVRANPRVYAEGVFRGFEALDD